MKIGEAVLFAIVALFISVSMVHSQTETTVNSNVTINVTEPETPASPGGGSSGGGGGGGGGGAGIVFQFTNFSLSKDLIKVRVKQGESVREIITVTNTGTRVITIDRVRVEGVSDFMAVSELTFTLLPGESKNVLIDIFAEEDEPPEAHVGRIIFEGGGLKRVANVIIEVGERSPLFDVSVKLAKTQLIPGENAVAEINVINMGDVDEIDILLYYAIKDFDGNVVAFREESLAIERELKVTRQLNIPLDTEVGSYAFYTRASFGAISAASSEGFKVVHFALAPLVQGKWIFIIVIVIIIVLIVLFVLWKKGLLRFGRVVSKKPVGRVPAVPVERKREERVVYVSK